MGFKFAWLEYVSFAESGDYFTTFPYKINNNLDGSFSFITTTTDTIPQIYLNDDTKSVWYTLTDSSYIGNGMKKYTYRIHWGRTFAQWVVNDGIKMYWDRVPIYTDELLNYEDTELIEAVRTYFTSERHRFCAYNFVNASGNTNIDTMLNYNIFSPTIYAIFAMNANDNNFLSCPLYNAMYLSSYNTPIKNTYTSIVMVPIMEMNNFSMGKFTQASINNSIQDIYDIQNDTNFAKKFLGYYKAPTAFNLNDAGNYFANWFNASSQISAAGLRYCNFGLSTKVQKKCVAFQMVMVSYVNNFRIPFNIPITTDYGYKKNNSNFSSTQLDHVHLTQIFDYKIGATSAPYTKLLAQFGLNKSNWSNLTTYYYNAGKVNMGFSDGIIIQSPTNSDSKIYYGSTLPYLYDGYVDWNIQNRTALNAKVNYGLSGAIGNILGTFGYIANKSNPSSMLSNQTYQENLSWGRTTAYDVLQWIKGGPTYSQQIRQAQISNPANLITNADASGSYADINYYFIGTYNRRAVIFEMSDYTADVIQFANQWLFDYGFGGVPRFLSLTRDNAGALHNGSYLRITNNTLNYAILKSQYNFNFNNLKSDAFTSQFIVKSYDDILNEAYEWMCGGFIY